MKTQALSLVVLPLIGVSLALSAATALAQGTAEQREACAADAIQLCSDTIPDIEKTTACMKAHESQLSRRCHRVFAAEMNRRGTGDGGDARLERGRPDDFDRPRRRAYRADEDYSSPPRAERRAPDESYDGPRQADRTPPGPDWGYDEPPPRAERFGYGPGGDEEGPRRVERAPYGPDDDYDHPRRAERMPPGPYGDDGYGPRQYLYMTPRGPAQAPDDPY